MAITSVNEVSGQRDVRITSDGMELTRFYAIVVDTPGTDTVAVSHAVGLPQRGDSHPFNPVAKVADVVVTQRDGSLIVYDVQIVYNTKDVTEDENPLLRDPIIDWSSVKTQEAYQEDFNGKPTTNSAGVPFDPPLVRDVTRPALTITRNQPNFSWQQISGFFDSVNSGTFFNALPGEVKFASASGSSDIENEIPFWRVTYEFHFRLGGWNVIEVLDQGLDELVREIPELPFGEPGPPVPIGRLRAITRDIDEEGANAGQKIPVTDPVPLDGSGLALPKVDVEGNLSQMVFLPFQPYVERDFSLLNLEP